MTLSSTSAPSLIHLDTCCTGPSVSSRAHAPRYHLLNMKALLKLWSRRVGRYTQTRGQERNVTRMLDSFVKPEYARPGVDLNADLNEFMKRLGIIGAMQDSDILSPLAQAKKARTSAELWESGVFDQRTVPWLDSTDGIIALSQQDADYSSAQKNARMEPSDLETLLTQMVPKPRCGDNRAAKDQVEQSFKFKRCCACAGLFEYDLGDDASAYVLSGLPPNGVSYTAMSYVWDKVHDIVVQCESCSYLTVFPIHSLAKLHDLMSLAGSSEPVWLDAISIDQGDASDIAAQVSVMGTIYENATGVAVLLPQSDNVGFEALKDITRMAKIILRNPEPFFLNRKDPPSRQTSVTIPLEEREAEQTFRLVIELSKEFLSAVENIESTIQELRYSSRAWTFQEWSLAKDLHVQFEGSTEAETITFLKSTVFSCASLLCQYIIRQGDRAEIDLPWRGKVTRIFDIIRRLLPLEDRLLSPNEVDLAELDFQMKFPSTGCTELLRLCTRQRTTELERKMARLQLMLSAFGTSGRQATVPADTVACWASMCNVPYIYSKDDSASTALRKAVEGIRDMGLNVFDFIPPKMQLEPHQRTLFSLLSTIQQVSHAKEPLEYSGLSFLTGCVDTLLYIQMILAQDLTNYMQHEDLKGHQKVVEATNVVGVATLSDIEEIIAMFAFYSSGRADANVMFYDLATQIGALLTTMPAQLLAMYKLIVVHIDTLETASKTPRILPTWAICPVEVPIEALSIEREPINGVFTLWAHGEDISSAIAYMCVTDCRSGTYLLQSDDTGTIKLSMDTPRQIGVDYSLGGGRFLTDRRVLECKVLLDDAHP